MPTLQLMPREEIISLRAKLLTEAGLEYERLMRGAVDYSLTPEQLALAEDIKDLDYLLELS